LTSLEHQRLRWQLYNATVESVRQVHDDLVVLRVRGDDGSPRVEAGQYTLLGLGDWEPRIDASVHSTVRRHSLIRRVYSVTCPLVNDAGHLARVNDHAWLEFYIALVSKPGDDPPSLTPRLFTLLPGDRLYLGEHISGRYTLAPVGPDDDVIFCATGTGEAPHNAMIAELLARGHRGRIVSATTTRFRYDLAYLTQHRSIERQWSNYRYLPLTTREAENLDPAHPDYVGKLYLQHVFGDESVCEDMVGFVPRPGRSHFFLCGNPAMIGLPRRRSSDTPVFPQPKGMAQLLTELGFRLDEGHTTGDVHFEKYW